MTVRPGFWLAFSASLVVLIALGIFAIERLEAPALPICTPPNGVAAHRFPGDLPERLKQALKQLGPIAAPGEKFNATDVSNGEPQSRVIFVWSNKARWMIAIEHGGRAYHVEIYVYNLAPDGSPNVISIFQLKQGAEVCQTAEPLLTAP